MSKITKEEYDNDVERASEIQTKMLESLREFEAICNKYRDHGLPVANYESYVFASLTTALTAEHSYLCRDQNLSDVIKDLEELESELDFTEAGAEAENDD